MLLLPVLITYICEDASLIESLVDVVSNESYYAGAIIIIDFDGMERLIWSYVLNSRNCNGSTDVAELTRLTKISANNLARWVLADRHLRCKCRMDCKVYLAFGRVGSR